MGSGQPELDGALGELYGLLQPKPLYDSMI